MRSKSDYLPAPDRLPSPRAAAPAHFGQGPPYTPAESPRQASTSPENAKTPLGVEGYPGLGTSHTDPRFHQNLARRSSLGSSFAASRPSTAGRMPVPSLSIRIPSHLPPSPSPLSGRMQLVVDQDEQPTLSSSLGRTRRPTLAKRFATSMRDPSDGLLPKPSLSSRPFDMSASSSGSIDALRRPSGSCSSLARLLNEGTSDWRAGDDMVL